MTTGVERITLFPAARRAPPAARRPLPAARYF